MVTSAKRLAIIILTTGFVNLMNHIALLYFKKTVPICVQYMRVSQGDTVDCKRRTTLGENIQLSKFDILKEILSPKIGRSGKEKRGGWGEGKGQRDNPIMHHCERVGCLWESQFGSGLEYCQLFHFKLPSSFPFMFHRSALLLQSWKESRILHCMLYLPYFL